MHLLESQLYYQDAGGTPLLRGVRCEDCGFLDFPYQSFGCQNCGAFGESLIEESMPPKGSVLATTRVDHYTGKDIEAPFGIAKIQLASGPVIQSTLSAPTSLPYGTAVSGTLVKCRSEVAQDLVLELRFEADEEPENV